MPYSFDELINIPSYHNILYADRNELKNLTIKIVLNDYDHIYYQIGIVYIVCLQIDDGIKTFRYEIYFASISKRIKKLIMSSCTLSKNRIAIYF